MRNSLGNKIKTSKQHLNSYQAKQENKLRESTLSSSSNFDMQRRQTIPSSKQQKYIQPLDYSQNNRRTITMNPKLSFKSQVNNDHIYLNQIQSSLLKLSLQIPSDGCDISQQLKDKISIVIEQIQSDDLETLYVNKKKQYCNLQRPCNEFMKQCLSNLKNVYSDFSNIKHDQNLDIKLFKQLEIKKLKIEQKLERIKLDNLDYLLECQPLQKQMLQKYKQENKIVERLKQQFEIKKRNIQSYLQSQLELSNRLDQPIAELTTQINQIKNIQCQIKTSKNNIINQSKHNIQLKQIIRQNAYKNYNSVEQYLKINNPEEWKSMNSINQHIQQLSNLISCTFSKLNSLTQLTSLTSTNKQRLISNNIQNEIMIKIISQTQHMQINIQSKQKQIIHLRDQIDICEKLKDNEENESQLYINQTLQINNKLSSTILAKQKIINSLEMELERFKRSNRISNLSAISKSSSEFNKSERNSQFKPMVEQFYTSNNPYNQICCHCIGRIQSNAKYCLNCSALAHSSCVSNGQNCPSR